MEDAILEEEDLEGHPSEYATREEAEVAILCLSSLEKKKLMVAALVWWKRFRLQNTEFTPEDLLQEAIRRTLETERPKRWRKAVTSIVKHLDRAMENIAGHHQGRLVVEEKALQVVHSLDDYRPSPTASTPRPIATSNAESQLAAREDLKQLEAFFGEDVQGYQAVCCRALGMDTSEIMRELGIDANEWETIRKRVQRKLAKYLSGKEELS